MNREAVFIPEKKDKLQNIKKKYNNLAMSDETAAKIRRLDITSNVLKAATAAVGVVTVVDLFVPDPVMGVDEVGLSAITGLLGYASTLVDNKARNLASDQDASIKMDEVTKLTEQIGNAAKAVKGNGNSK